MTVSATAGGTRQPETIGRYRVETLIGVGGFATVVRARDPALETDVAIKILDPAGAADPEIRERFLTEARLLRVVDSPALVTVYDIGELADGRPYFVMEFAGRGSLADRMPTAPDNVDAASLLAIVDAVESALSALHRQDVVHRDIKPANLLIAGPPHADSSTSIRTTLLETDDRLLLSDLGIAKIDASAHGAPTIMGGTPHYRAPEQAILGSEIAPTADVFGATAMMWQLLTGSMPPEPAALAVQLPSLPSAWQPVFESGMHEQPEHRYPTISRWAEACRAAIESPATTGFRSAEPNATCPYKGLAAFQPADAGLFFGRESLVDELVSRLQTSNALIIGGPSGSGKSSLLRAGLLPALERGALPGSQTWHTVLFSPGSDAVAELAYRLARVGDGELTADDLRADPRNARRVLPDTSTVLVAVDQFEELFTSNPEPDHTVFIDALAALGSDHHRAVLALRADFYDTCAHHGWLADRINENQVLVGPLGRAELRQAIEGPAHRVGLRIEDGLVDTILEDAGASRGSLPLVAHALMETWLRRRGHMLTVEGYEAAGGVAGAIAQRAESTYDQLDAPGRAAARSLLLQLTQPGESAPETRRRVSWGDIDETHVPNEVIETFADARLLTVDEEAIDLAHETLLRSWPRARRWIDEARDDLRTAQRVRTAADEWAQSDRDDELLWSGTRLASILHWATDHSDTLGRVERAFLDASRAARDRAADEEAAAEKRRRRTRRNATVALGVLAVAAVIASIAAFVGLRRAQDSERTARDAEAMARSQSIRSVAAAAEAQSATDPLFGLALAIESAALETPAIPEARGAIVAARVALDAQAAAPLPLADPIQVGDALSVAIDPAATTMFVGRRDGTIGVWDLTTRQPTAELEAHAGGVQELTVDPSGTLLASAGDKGALVVWDIASGTPRMLRTAQEGATDTDDILWSTAFSADGSQLALATEAGNVYIYDVESGRLLGDAILSAPNRDAITVAWLPSGDAVAVGNGFGELIVIDLTTNSAEATLSVHGSDIWEIVPNADGTVFTASSGGQVGQVDLVDGRNMNVDVFGRMGEDAPAEPLGLAVRRNGAEIVVGSADGRIRRVNVADGSVIGITATAHGDRVIDGVLSADGTLYASLGDDQQVRLWDIDNRARRAGSRVTIGEPLTAAAPVPEGIAVGTAGGAVLVTDSAGQTVSQWLAGDGEVTALTLGDPGLIVGDDAGTLTVLDPNTGTVIESWPAAHGGQILAIATRADAIFTGGVDGSIKRWQVGASEPTEISDRTLPQVNDLAVTPDGDELIAVDLGGTISFWHADGGPSRDVMNPGEDELAAVDVAPDGASFVVTGFTESASIFTLGESVERTHRLTPVPKSGIAVEFTVDGTTVVAYGESGAVVLFDVASGRRFGPVFRPHPAGTDGSDLLLVDQSIWTTSTGGTLHRLDVLDVRGVCDSVRGIIDPGRLADFLAGEPLMACAS